MYVDKYIIDENLYYILELNKYGIPQFYSGFNVIYMALVIYIQQNELSFSQDKTGMYLRFELDNVLKELLKQKDKDVCYIGLSEFIDEFTVIDGEIDVNTIMTEHDKVASIYNKLR